MPNKSLIYLDYNATAPLRPDVKAAMDAVMGQALNPSSIHASGRAARKLVEEARKNILRCVNGETLVFCSSGTEANNLALAQADSHLISSIEHDSIYKTLPNAKLAKVEAEGIIDLEDFEKLLKAEKPKLVSIMLANNETGVIQPIKEIAELAHKYGALVHTDAVQAFGKIDVDFKNLGVDMMTISCHKVGGPVGIAALVHKSSLELKPILFGGGQEKNKRPGTENVPSIVGFGEVSQLLSRQPGASVGVSERELARSETIHNVSRETSKLRDYLENEILAIAPDAIIYGKSLARLPNTSYIAMPDIEAATQLIHFDTNGICVSSGSACSSGKVEVSRILKAMNAPLAKNALRISIGWATTPEEIEQFIKSWREMYLRAKNAAA